MDEASIIRRDRARSHGPSAKRRLRRRLRGLDDTLLEFAPVFRVHGRQTFGGVRTQRPGGIRADVFSHYQSRGAGFSRSLLMVFFVSRRAARRAADLKSPPVQAAEACVRRGLAASYSAALSTLPNTRVGAGKPQLVPSVILTWSSQGSR